MNGRNPLFRARLPFLRTAIICVLTAVTILFAGCGGGGGGASSSLAPIVKSNVTVLPADGTVNAVRPDASHLTISGTLPTLNAGDVVVSSSGSGMLVKVVGVRSRRTRNGVDTVDLDVKQGTLEDIFQQAEFHFSKDLTPSDISSVNILAPGVTTPQRSVRGDIYTTEFSLQKMAVLGTGPLSAGVTLDGTIGLKIGLDWDFKVENSHLTHFLLSPSVTISPETSIKCSAAVTATLAKVDIAKIYATPITAFVGPVPVVFQPIVTVSVKADGSIEAGVEVTSKSSITCRAGVECTDGNWRAIGDVSKDFQPPTVSAGNYSQYSIKISVPEVELSFMLYGVAGPYVDIDVPYFESSVKLSDDKGVPVATYDLSRGISAEAGAKIAVEFEVLSHSFDYTLADYKVAAIDFKEHFPTYPKQVRLSGTGDVTIN